MPHHYFASLAGVVHILQYAEVVAVALLADDTLLHGGLDGALRLVAMGAVGEAAAVQHTPHLGEEVAQFLRVEVHHAELLDAGGVDQVSGERRAESGERRAGSGERRGGSGEWRAESGEGDGVYFGEGGGVHALEAPVRNLPHLEAQAGAQRVEYGRLAHAGVAAEEDRLAGDGLPQGIHAGALEGRHLQHRVSGAGVDGLQLVVRLPQPVVVEVHLVENQACRNVVGLGGHQQAVDETRRGARQAEGGHHAQQVDVGGNDVCLLRQLGGAAHDVVATVAHIVDDAGAVVLQLNQHTVAHRHGVGLLVAPQAVVAAQAAVHGAALRGHTIPAAGGAHHQPLQPPGTYRGVTLTVIRHPDGSLLTAKIQNNLQSAALTAKKKATPVPHPATAIAAGCSSRQTFRASCSPYASNPAK